MHKEGQGRDVFPITVVVNCCEGQDKFQEPRRRRKQFALATVSTVGAGNFEANLWSLRQLIADV